MTATEQLSQLHCPVSLAELELVDSPAERAYDNLTEMAQKMLRAPVSLVSIVEFAKDRQYFKSQQGLPEPWASRRQTPLSHSFCQHVVIRNAPLVVHDATKHELVADNLAVKNLNVQAYLGVPIYEPSGVPVGALCVIDSSPRKWSEADVVLLEQLALCVSDAIRLKGAVKTSEDLRQEQSEFSYAISHDLKAPANTLQFILNELREVVGDSATDTTQRLFAIGGQTLARMCQQTESILNYTRTLSGDREVENVDLGSLVAGVVDDLKGDVVACKAEVTVDPLPHIKGNPPQLRMLFQNLINNALKFRKPELPPKITLKAITSASATRIAVRDNGIGISDEHRETIFKLFGRLHVRSEYPGTGIGLALCKRVVRNHNGSIEVVSEPGVGSEFVVILPTGRR